MSESILSPIDLGFSEFVSKLITDTFEAVVSSSISQEENWAQLSELLSKDIQSFTDAAIEDSFLEDEMVRMFPADNGGTLIVAGTSYTPAKPERGLPDSPPVETLTGYKPSGRKLSEKDVAEIYAAVKLMLGRRQYDILSNVYAKGTTQVMVDAGKINAKLNFQILQESEDEEEPGSSDSGSSDATTGVSTGGSLISGLASNLNLAKHVYIKNKLPVFSGLSKPAELQKVHFFVKPPTDRDPQSHQVKANVYSEVELHFKTIR